MQIEDNTGYSRSKILITKSCDQLSNMATTSHTLSFHVELIKNLKFTSLVILVTFKYAVATCSVAAIWSNAAIGHYQHRRYFFWTVLF